MPEPAATIPLRRLRLATGLTLFAYVGTHLIDHALGNVSIAAMQADLVVQRWLWQGAIGTAALYGALLIHYALGLRAYYERRDFGWTAGEVAQTVLGLAIPFLLVNHIFATRVALWQFGLLKGYPQELHSFWVARRDLGLVQLILLLVAWIHGCLGLFFWLRLKPSFPRCSGVLLCASVLIPLLALLGAFQSGRQVITLSRDPVWRAVDLAPGVAGTSAEQGALARERDATLVLLASLFALATVARGLRSWRERYRGTLRVTYADGRTVRVPLGFSVLEASRAARIPHASLCGGRARCSTCRVRIVRGTVPPPSPGEQAVLDRVGAGAEVRLACQLRPAADVTVAPLLPPNFPIASLRARRWPRAGEERFILVLVADMRQSMTLAETRLPFDAVFMLDRFVATLSQAVREAGGVANQFTGDGILAIFGLNASPELACRQAIRAVGEIGMRIATLNASLGIERSPPVRFGLGVHGGQAVVGEILLDGAPIFTTLGTVAGVATRLEAFCKRHACEAVISDLVCERSGLALASLPLLQADVRGSAHPVAARLVADARTLAQEERAPIRDDP